MKKDLIANLTETESYFHTLFELANDGLFILDHEGVILDVNEAGHKRLGYEKSEMTGHRIGEFDAPEFVPLVTRRIKDLFEKGSLRFESMHLHKNGTHMPVEVNARTVKLDGQVRIFSIIRDITQSKKLEEKVFESEAKYHALFEFSKDFKLIASLSGEIEEINETCLGALGYTKEEVLSKNVSFLVSPEDRVTISEKIDEISRSGSAVFEYNLLTRSGKKIPVEVSSRLIEISAKQYIYSIIREISERKEAENNIRKSEEKYRAVIETLGDGFWITDNRGRFLEVNEVYQKMSGYSKEELLTMGISDIEALEDPETTKKRIEKIIKDGHDRFESKHRRKNGEIWPVEIVTNFWSYGGGTFFVFIIDISERKKAEDERNLMARVFQNSGEAMLISDAQNRIQTVNPAFCELTGYTMDEVIGKDPKIVSAGRQTREFYRTMWEDVIHKGRWQGEIWDRRKDGTEYPKWLSIATVRDDNNRIINYIANFSDITERKKAEAEILELAYHDTLTGLHNRHSLITHLDHELLRAKRSGRRIGIMFIDLDRFKAINDTLGHHVGDQLLIEVAERMRSAARESDIIARLGGDEFVVILLDIATKEDAMHVAEKIVNIVSGTYEIENFKVYTSPSIGISIFPDDGKEPNIIMQRADMAMYFSKTGGGGQAQFYDPAMNLSTTEKLSIENHLRYAVENNELSLHFQPMVSKEGKIIAAEALVRWEHPELGMLPPDKFISIAEESNLILQIGLWVIMHACKSLARWKKMGHTDLLIAVNISAKEFLQPDFTGKILDIVNRAGISPRDLEIEVTESTAMESPENIFKIMKELKESNIRLSIDDFGTGYSSLAYLARFPIDQLKIDRSFIRDMDKDKTVMAVTEATIALAKQLNKQVVAEGVENIHQSEVMFKSGVDLQQGYYFSKPLPEEEFIKFLEKFN